MHSLHRRLTLSLLAVLAILIAVGTTALYFGIRSTLLARFDADLRFKALVVITGTQQKGRKLDVRFSDHFLREFDDDVGTDFYHVRTPDGKTVERSDALNRDDLPERFGTLQEPEYWDLDLPGGRGHGRAIGIRFTPRIDRRDEEAKAHPQEVTVVVAKKRDELDADLRGLRLALTFGGLGLLGATSLAVPIVLRPGLRPIGRIAALAQTIDANNLDQRFPVDDVPRELQPICERLNDLLARLAVSFERERRFSGDLAHEMLTPVTEIRAIAESALKWPESAGPEDHERIVEITQRMESLVQQMLDLARTEDGHVALDIRPVDISRLIHDVIGTHAAAAQARGIETVLDGPDTLVIATDPGVLQTILGNLVTNAFAYAPKHSTVRLSWHVQDSRMTFSIANPAPDIRAEDIPRLFDRFWRKDSARTGSRHSGLGLPLAAQLARLLGGTLAAQRSRDTDELVFTLTIDGAPHTDSRE